MIAINDTSLSSISSDKETIPNLQNDLQKELFQNLSTETACMFKNMILSRSSPQLPIIHISSYRGWDYMCAPTFSESVRRYDVPTIYWIFSQAQFTITDNSLRKGFGPITSAATDSEKAMLPTWAAHIDSYVSDKAVFQEKTILKSMKRDVQSNALLSCLLQFSDLELYVMREHMSPLAARLISVLVQERSKNKVLVLSYGKHRVPFMRTHFVVLTEVFKKERQQIFSRLDSPLSAQFSLYDEKFPGMQNFVSHLTHVCDLFFQDRVQELSTLLRQQYPSPIHSILESPLPVYNQARAGRKPTTYITGQACCGKTTILRHLSKHYGVQFCSRSQAGTFAGKAHTPIAIAALHGALEYILGEEGIVGDRGPIDNPLWGYIMHFFDSSPEINPRDLVRRCVSAWSQHVNEYYLKYLSQQRVVVLVDPSPSRNRARMLERGEGGDYNRARIPLYPHVQFIFYYMVSVLCGWTVILVPYKLAGGGRHQQDWVFDSARYADELIPQIALFLGLRKQADDGCESTKLLKRSLSAENGTPRMVGAKKPKGNFEFRFDFAKESGVYK